MRGLNKITLMGNLTRDPEIKQTNTGTPVARIGIATSRQWKDKNGEIKEDVQFHTVVAWSNLAQSAVKYLKIGSPAYIEGRMTYRKYKDRNGIEKTIPEIIASEIIFLPTKGDKQIISTDEVNEGVDEIDEVFGINKPE